MPAHDLIVSAKDVRLPLSPADQAHIKRLIGGRVTRDTVTAAVGESIAKLLAMTAGDAPPLMQDVDVFTAQKLLAEPAAAVDSQALESILEAWQQAEESLRPEARVGVRLLETVVHEVMACSNRDLFVKWFARDLAPRVKPTQARYLRAYLDVFRTWLEDGGGWHDKGGHYLEHVMRDMFVRLVLPALQAKKRTYCLKHMQVALETVDDLLFQ